MSESSAESIQKNVIGPERFEEFLVRWKLAMRETLLDYTEFGHYCHERGDLVGDTEDRLKEPLDSEIAFDLEYYASDIVEELEAKLCGFCNDDN